MQPIAHATTKSFIRTARRERTLLLISSLGEAYLGQIARGVGLTAWTVRGLLLGRPPYYSVELALVPLGLVEEIATTRGRAFRITNKGRRKARSIMAARRRAIDPRMPRAVAPTAAAPSIAPALLQENAIIVSLGGASADWKMNARYGPI